MKRGPRVYIAGPIEGVADYRERFAEAEGVVRRMYPDAEVYNPAAELDGSGGYEFCMRRCVDEVFRSDVVVMMRGWMESPGARAEQALAKCLKRMVVFL